MASLNIRTGQVAISLAELRSAISRGASKDALDHWTNYWGEFSLCPKCRTRWVLPLCGECGAATEFEEDFPEFITAEDIAKVIMRMSEKGCE